MIARFATYPWSRMSPRPCTCYDRVSALARAHAGRLSAVARKQGLGPSDALDAVQEAFRTFIGRPDAASLDDDAAARQLTVMTKNAARNLRRRHHRSKPHLELDAVPMATAAEDTLERSEVAAQLGGCMASLGDVHRHVITLRVLEELSGQEAAETLGLSAGNVAVLLHRAKKQLERCMRGEV